MHSAIKHPALIQGGMGIGVSNWELAKAVSCTGSLGIISGTASDTIMIRRLQDGDSGGHVRRALASFPHAIAVREVLRKYFRPEGRAVGQPYLLLPLYQHVTSVFRQLITSMGTFVEVFLAKEGHTGKVGINLLTKIQLPTLPSIFGALLAKVDYLCMGAGIPKEVPGVLQAIINWQPASMKHEIIGDSSEVIEHVHINPQAMLPDYQPELSRPYFFPIVSSHSLATMLVRKAAPIDGLVIEDHIAGGHNAPPRDSKIQTQHEEPRYGQRDAPDFAAIRALGVPFWIAGGMGRRDGVEDAKALGAHGIQVGTPFAFCRESGVSPLLKQEAIKQILAGTASVRTEPDFSPTGYPFKVLDLENTLSRPEIYQRRRRACDLGYLREAYRKNSGGIGYRCPAEPVEDFVKKGGELERTCDKKCLCNGLIATVGQPQIHDKAVEPAIVTCSSDLRFMGDLLAAKGDNYSARDVVEFLLPAAG